MSILDPIYKFSLRADLINNKEFLPTRAEPKASGWDVRSAQEDRQPIAFHPFMKYMIPLGFRAFCPEGWWFKIVPRSSTFAKKELDCLYGTVDQNYEGFCYFCVKYSPQNALSDHPNTLIVNFGDPIAQIIPVKRQEMLVQEVNNDEYDKLCKERGGQRGTGGFGSTDLPKQEKQLSLSYEINPTMNFNGQVIQGKKF